MKRTLLTLLTVVLNIPFLFISFLNKPVVAQEKKLITGTFLVADLNFKSEEEYEKLFVEMQNTGIDTVILTQISNLKQDCNTGVYTEEVDRWFNAGDPPAKPTFIKMAKKYNMKVYLSIASYSTCINPFEGTPGDKNSDMGRLIDFSVRSVSKIIQLVESTGVSWNSPTIAGWYITPEADTRNLANQNSQEMKFLDELSYLLKRTGQTKKIMLSPYQYEAADYATSKLAFQNVLKYTDVDILVPQDSVGTGVTSTIEKSVEHFKALQDAKTSLSSSKEVWANIETFGNPGEDRFVNYSPAPMSRVSQQIDAVSPYVSKTITWIYTHTMMSSAISDNLVKNSIYSARYTPTEYLKRLTLRRDYLSYYNFVPWEISSASLIQNDKIEVKGVFGKLYEPKVMAISYIDGNGTITRYNKSFISTGNQQSVIFDLGEMPYYVKGNAFVPYIADSKFLPAYVSYSKGNVEYIRDGKVVGWAADLDNPIVTLHFYLDAPYDKGGKILGSTTTSMNRPDVMATIGYGNNSGFSFTIPNLNTILSDNKAHKIYVYSIGKNDYGVYEPNSLLNQTGTTIPSTTTDSNNGNNSGDNTNDTEQQTSLTSGDLNKDGIVDTKDSNLFFSGYSSGVYTIYDYNNIVTNFGNTNQ